VARHDLRARARRGPSLPDNGGQYRRRIVPILRVGRLVGKCLAAAVERWAAALRFRDELLSRSRKSLTQPRVSRLDELPLHGRRASALGSAARRVKFI
jgi:hypothetical protein